MSSALLRFAAERHPVVARGVVVMLHRKAVQFLREPFARFQPGIGPGDALRAIGVAGERAQFFQFGDGSLWVEWQERGNSIGQFARSFRAST